MQHVWVDLRHKSPGGGLGATCLWAVTLGSRPGAPGFWHVEQRRTLKIPCRGGHFDDGISMKLMSNHDESRKKRNIKIALMMDVNVCAVPKLWKESCSRGHCLCLEDEPISWISLPREILQRLVPWNLPLHLVVHMLVYIYIPIYTSKIKMYQAVKQVKH